MQLINPMHIDIAEKFRKQSGIEGWPYNMADAVKETGIVELCYIKNLSLNKIRNWLTDRRLEVPLKMDADNRKLHGLTISKQKIGLVFVDASDSPEEIRYTIAHEVSHFILECQIPHEKGMAVFSKSPVSSKLSIGDKIAAVLRGIDVNYEIHLLEKKGNGEMRSMKIMESENTADALACELLAPSNHVIAEVKAVYKGRSFYRFKDLAAFFLLKKYELPDEQIAEYALRLTYKAMGAPSIIDRFGL